MSYLVEEVKHQIIKAIAYNIPSFKLVGNGYFLEVILIKMRLFVNNYEEITHSILSSRCQKHEVHVFAKVRLADVFCIDFKN